MIDLRTHRTRQYSCEMSYRYGGVYLELPHCVTAPCASAQQATTYSSKQRLCLSHLFKVAQDLAKELVFFEFPLPKLTTCAIRSNNNALISLFYTWEIKSEQRVERY